MEFFISSIDNTWDSTGGEGIEQNIVVTDYGTLSEKQLRWGLPFDDEKSGVGFTPNTISQIELNEIVEIGRFRNFNFVVVGGTSCDGVTLTLSVVIDGQPVSFKIYMNIDETTNSTGDPWLDRDFITILSTENVMIWFGNNNYRFETVGFGPDPEHIQKVFEVPEGGINTAYLYCRIVRYANDDDIISIYNFEENNITKDSINNFDLNLFGNIGWQDVTNSGLGAIVFDGNSYAYLKNKDLTKIHPFASRFRGTEASIHFWFYIDELPAQGDTMYLLSKGFHNFKIYIDYQGYMTIVFGQNNKITKTTTTNPISFNINTWYHLSLTLSTKKYGHSHFGYVYQTGNGNGEIIIRNDAFETVYHKVEFIASNFQNTLGNLYFGGISNEDKKYVKLSGNPVYFKGKMERIEIRKRYVYEDENLKICDGTFIEPITRKRNNFTGNSNVLFHFEFEDDSGEIDTLSGLNKLQKSIMTTADHITPIRFWTKNGNKSMYFKTHLGNLYIPWENLNDFPLIDGSPNTRLCIYFWAKTFYNDLFLISNYDSSSDRNKGYCITISRSTINIYWGYNSSYETKTISITPNLTAERKWYFFALDLDASAKTFNAKIYDEEEQLLNNLSTSFANNLYLTGNANPVYLCRCSAVDYYLNQTLINEIVFAKTPFSIDDIKLIRNGNYKYS